MTLYVSNNPNNMAHLFDYKRDKIYLRKVTRIVILPPMFKLEREQIVTMRKLGMTYGEISETMGITREGIHWLLDPSKSQARMIVRLAVGFGILKKPNHCEKCFSIPPKKRSRGVKPWRLAAHHEDYSKPVEVVWLCPRCHGKADAARRLREGKERGMPLIPGSACVVCGAEVQLSLSRPRLTCSKPCAAKRQREQATRYRQAARLKAVIQGPAISEKRLNEYLDSMPKD